jgi:hypothetical protein
MADKEKPVIAALDDANAMQEKIRARVRWLADQLSGKDLRAAEDWLADIIRSTEVTQRALKEIRRLEHERLAKDAERKRMAPYSEPDEIIAQLL